ncbi:MAG: hypothetical protein EON47_12025 [Acetobacteraceae bacterium]|nr:MAG: hypothetical protein EON47_12025 [Acetobacteraceae bacterium]
MGQLNIKDAALIAEAKALAELIGTSTTEAIRRSASRASVSRARRYEAIMAIAEEASKHFPPGSTSDHSDLYDENGLPK